MTNIFSHHFLKYEAIANTYIHLRDISPSYYQLLDALFIDYIESEG